MKYALKKYKEPFNSIFDNFGEDIGRFGEDIGKILEDFRPFEYPYYKTVKNVGYVNMESTDKEYKIEIAAPGFSKEELSVSLEDGVMTIKGERANETKEEKKNYTRREFSKSSFKRSFSIPDDASDDIKAQFENGILLVSLNKKALPPKEEPKKIDIK